jgi:lysozyme family protein
MIENFEKALDFTLRHECVFEAGHEGDLNFVATEDVAGDNGGVTKYGIDETDHPDVAIAALNLEEATEIYREGEWRAVEGDALPAGLDIALFDTAVNLGTGRAVILLQRALVACGWGLVVDGDLGPATMNAALHHPAGDVWARLLQERTAFYQNIALSHPTMAKFLKGWLARVNDLRALLTGQA